VKYLIHPKSAPGVTKKMAASSLPSKAVWGIGSAIEGTKHSLFQRNKLKGPDFVREGIPCSDDTAADELAFE
jgi:hypothetical protein